MGGVGDDPPGHASRHGCGPPQALAEHAGNGERVAEDAERLHSPTCEEVDEEHKQEEGRAQVHQRKLTVGAHRHHAREEA